jgi:hypothetical protein
MSIHKRHGKKRVSSDRKWVEAHRLAQSEVKRMHGPNWQDIDPVTLEEDFEGMRAFYYTKLGGK